MKTPEFSIVKGNTRVITLTVSGVTFMPTDTLYFTVKSNPDNFKEDESALIQKVITVSTETQKFTIELTPDDTFIPAGSYVFDFTADFKDKGRVTLAKGNLNVTPIVTNRGI